MKASTRLVCTSVCLGVILALGAALGWSQAGTSTIRGTVLDPQGKFVAKAVVTLKNPSTSYSRTMATSDSGSFSFELVPVGDYTVEVEAAGFRKQVVSRVRAQVGVPLDLDVHLEIGSIDQVVQVEAGASAIALNTQDATLGNNLTYQQIVHLPMEARNVQELLTLQPGVTRQGYVAGARSDQSNITLDGVDINEAQTNALGSPVLRLNSEAIDEFRVGTVNSNANQGRSSAAQVNLVTRSGTNQFHGSVFEYNRNTIFTANNFFNNRSGLPRPTLIRNTFGGAVGGPIMKNKVFFFYSYEGRRDASQAAVGPRIVPLPSMGQGILTLRTASGTGPIVTLTTAQLNGIFPAVGIDAAAVQVFADAAKKYPANDYTVGDSIKNPDGSITAFNTAGFRFNASTPVHLNSHIARLDWNINSKQTAFFRYNMIYDLTTNAPFFPDTPGTNTWAHPYGFVAGHTWTINAHWVNNARYGLTRNGFSQLGDSTGANMSFRSVFAPLNFSRTISRVSPVHNIVDDVSWVKGGHTLQFGTNIRIIRNASNSFAGSFDTAQTNAFGYQGTTTATTDPINAYLTSHGQSAIASSFLTNAAHAATGLIGRFSNYSANLIYGPNLQLQPVGTPKARNFATESYDFYIQDAWKMSRNVTLTYGLRYGLSRPVYETHGFEVQPTIPFGQLFRNRADAALLGMDYNVPIVVNLSGPVNGGPSLYNPDHKNFQPRVAVAWSPEFDHGFLRKLFGGANTSAIRAGFGVYSDYFGEALAAFWDTSNTLGFSGSSQVSVNTYNVTDSPAPAFTGFDQNIRTFPNLIVTPSISFPQQLPQLTGKGALTIGPIQNSLDSNLVTPKEYTWNLTYERQIPGGVALQFSYIGRLGRHLLAQRDVATPVDLVDPKSGMDWYTAASTLEALRQANPNPSTTFPTIPTMPYFDNLFPANLAALMTTYYGKSCPGTSSKCIPPGLTPTQTIFWMARQIWKNNDWTDVQADLDDQRLSVGLAPMFYQSQYGALDAWSTIANSNYHAFTVSVRQRFRKSLTWDFNYTYSHSLDDASGLQSAGGYSGAALIWDPFRQRLNYASSDFDVRHLINVSGIYKLPFGRGQSFGHDWGHALDAVVGGWNISGIFRWNTGLPFFAPGDGGAWSTNFELGSSTTLTQPIQICNDRTNVKYFGCNTTLAYQSFRNSYPGEVGGRNLFRAPGYIDLDTGIFKTFNLAGAHLGENTVAELRWEVFNATNTQHFGFPSNLTIPAPTSLPATPPSNWSNFTNIQGSPRVMQVGLRIEF